MFTERFKALLQIVLGLGSIFAIFALRLDVEGEVLEVMLYLPVILAIAGESGVIYQGKRLYLGRQWDHLLHHGQRGRRVEHQLREITLALDVLLGGRYLRTDSAGKRRSR